MTHSRTPILLSLALGAGAFATLATGYAGVAKGLNNKPPVGNAAVPAADPNSTKTTHEPKTAEPTTTDPPPFAPGTTEPKTTEPIASGPKPTEPKVTEPKPTPTPNTPPHVALLAPALGEKLQLALGGTSAVVKFRVGDNETPAERLKVVVTSSNARVVLSGGTAVGPGGDVQLTVAPKWVSGGDTITILVEDEGGATARATVSVTVGPEQFPLGADWASGANKTLVLVVASNLNAADIGALRSGVQKLTERHGARLLGGDVFVVSANRVWRFTDWADAKDRDLFGGKDADPEEAFAAAFAKVRAALDGARAGREVKGHPALVLWHSLTTPKKVPEGAQEVPGARLLWTGERDEKQLTNPPTRALFPGRVDAYGTDIGELAKAASEALQP